jgi:sugar phosphate permease
MTKIQLIGVFALTFLSYAAYPCSRTYWAYIQDTMHNELDGYTANFTGIINLSFLFLYAVSMKL